MCGVVGIFSFKGEPVKNLKSIILKMNSMLRHRGPDQEGVFISKIIYVRLAIPAYL